MKDYTRKDTFLVLNHSGRSLINKDGRMWLGTRMAIDESGFYTLTNSFGSTNKGKLIDTKETVHGNIGKDRLNLIKDFTEKNVTENYDNLIFDIDFLIEYIKDGKKIVVHNDHSKWDLLMPLIPEFIVG